MFKPLEPRASTLLPRSIAVVLFVVWVGCGQSIDSNNDTQEGDQSSASPDSLDGNEGPATTTVRDEAGERLLPALGWREWQIEGYPEASDDIACIGDYRETYPEGPYGFEVGDVVAPFSFIDPDNQNFDLGDFYTPDSRGLLLVSVAFAWCPHCQNYQSELQAIVDDSNADTPLSVVVDVMQNQDREVPDAADLETFASAPWDEDLTLSYEVGSSEDGVCMARYLFNGVRGPQSALIDTQTMTILLMQASAGSDEAIIEMRESIHGYYDNNSASG